MGSQELDITQRLNNNKNNCVNYKPLQDLGLCNSAVQSPSRNTKNNIQDSDCHQGQLWFSGGIWQFLETFEVPTDDTTDVYLVEARDANKLPDRVFSITYIYGQNNTKIEESESESCSVMSNFLQPHSPWNSPTRVGSLQKLDLNVLI